MKRNSKSSFWIRLSPAGLSSLGLLVLAVGLPRPAHALLNSPGFPPASPAQARFPAPRSDKEDPRAPKNLTGQVVDKEGKGLAQAVVHLKNKKTLEVTTRISDAEGKFRFNGLNPETDYAVHAEYRGAMSPARNVSMFDEKKDVYLVLEIDTTKQ